MLSAIRIDLALSAGISWTRWERSIMVVGMNYNLGFLYMV